MINFALGFVIGSLFASSYVWVYNRGKKNKNTEIEEISNLDKEKMKRLQEGLTMLWIMTLMWLWGRGIDKVVSRMEKIWSW